MDAGISLGWQEMDEDGLPGKLTMSKTPGALDWV
jgi:hypothetical protein